MALLGAQKRLCANTGGSDVSSMPSVAAGKRTCQILREGRPSVRRRRSGTGALRPSNGRRPPQPRAATLGRPAGVSRYAP